MRFLAILVLLTTFEFPTNAHAFGAIGAGGTCNGNGTLTVQWTFYEDSPYGHPEWIGYDVLRSPANQCTGFERLNADIIPRGTGIHTLSFTDASPTTETLYEYQVIPVDANRNQLSLYDLDPGDFYQSCPDRSAPVALGTVEDIGWAVLIDNCPEFCLYGAYINDPPADIRAYAGTGIVLRFFGRMGCGSIEGCSLGVDRYEVAACVPVPTQSTTWGQIKARYH